MGAVKKDVLLILYKVYKVYKDKAFSQELRLLACS